MNKKTRKIDAINTARQTTDGDGVILKRIFGNQGMGAHDPFLLMDEFGSDDPEAYIGGFPSHPHRGFETVTYMLNGQMEHKDHLGNVGVIGPGDVQWMSAGRGVIHSEMPKQREGKMRGFQLWINLPASEKMTPTRYRELKADELPVLETASARIKIIAGSFQFEGQEIAGAVQELSTDPLYLDIHLSDDTALELPIKNGYTAILYVYEGSLSLAGEDKPIMAGQMATLSREGSVNISANEKGTRLILLAGKPIGEAVAHHGPFVMNTREEIEQAIRDYRDGTLTEGG